MIYGVLMLGFVVGCFAGGFVVALAAAADKPVSREDARLHLYQERGARAVYEVHRLRPGSVTAVRGSMVTINVDDCTAFGERR